MASSQADKAAKIDAMMEQASRALVARDYFACERLAVGALRRANQEQDFERMARIILPLQEARRLKRQMALDTDRVAIVDSEIPHGKTLVSGCYLVVPPRVGVDGRLIREQADESRVPVVVVVREPTSRDGLWPLVAVGPVTVRAKVAPPAPRPVKPPKKLKAGKKATPAPSAPAAAPPAPAPQPPSPEWFAKACEELGDAAISQVAATLPAAARVAALLDRLEAHPSHEKLHQRLEEACREAVLEPLRKRKPGMDDIRDDDF